MRETTLLYITWILQISILLIGIALIILGDTTWLVACIASFLITLLPTFLKKSARVVLPVWMVLWIVVSLFLHTAGGALDFYNSIPFWDHITHAASSSLVAALGFVVAITVDLYVESIFFPKPFVSFFVLMFGMAMGVLWEIMEFAEDQLLGTSLQYGPGPDDTILDLFFDGLASLIVAVAVSAYLRRVSPENFVKSLGFHEAKQSALGRIVMKRVEKVARTKQ
jgi:hypothetical protein